MSVSKKRKIPGHDFECNRHIHRFSRFLRNARGSISWKVESVRVQIEDEEENKKKEKRKKKEINATIPRERSATIVALNRVLGVSFDVDVSFRKRRKRAERGGGDRKGIEVDTECAPIRLLNWARGELSQPPRTWKAPVAGTIFFSLFSSIMFIHWKRECL